MNLERSALQEYSGNYHRALASLEETWRVGSGMKAVKFNRESEFGEESELQP